ncbi:MAG TPA: 30S ribosomal protein S27ae [Thermoprotei archaeon]|nr:30S ribosomal protein S27ae [TACK group archaeon]HEV51295.1 30S ribosomal protein S27ae [Thermoprotei archaeon]
MSEVHKLYDYSYETGTITLKNRKCPRCGSVMAKHTVGGARWSCGKCGYTEYVKGS